ncbi:hypothetical protein FQA39_LY11927 [Lamprigera yunnana]|nr:hypothetical protein FQA39_LY11927 [Lamprigera yunnana]
MLSKKRQTKTKQSSHTVNTISKVELNLEKQLQVVDELFTLSGLKTFWMRKSKSDYTLDGLDYVVRQSGETPHKNLRTFSKYLSRLFSKTLKHEKTKINELRRLFSKSTNAVNLIAVYVYLFPRMVWGFIVRRIDVVITLPLSYCLCVVTTMSRRGLSYEKLLKELEDLQQYESTCELPSTNNSTDEDSDFVIVVPESQKSSSDSDETTPLLSTLTRKNSNTDIASTSSCAQPIRSSLGISRGTK